MSGPAATTNPRFPLFDSLRAIAALSVFTVHLPFLLSLGPDNRIAPYLLNLNSGVAVFFLISGFLLYRPFAQARRTGQARPGTRSFAVRRTLRIVPAYWVAITVTVLALGASGESPLADDVFSRTGIPAYFGFLQVYDSETVVGGISAAWSLCVEVTFYAMLPLWAWAMSKLPAPTTRAFVSSELAGLVGLTAIGIVWTGIAATHDPPTAATAFDVSNLNPALYVLPGYLDHFALGMGLAVASVALAGCDALPRPLRLVDRAPWIPWLAAAAAFALLVRIAVHYADDYAVRYLMIHVLQGVLAFGLLLPAVFGDPTRGWVRRLLGCRPLLWIGLVSYGLYLLHVVVLTKLTEWGLLGSLGKVGFTALGLAGSLAAAALSFYLVERPALVLGRRLTGRVRSQDADVRMDDILVHERVSEQENSDPQPAQSLKS